MFTAKARAWLLDNFVSSRVLAYIHGDARGADREAANCLTENDIGPVIPFPADWDKFGNVAGPIRNKVMLEWALATRMRVIVAAFPGGNGTADMCRIAKEAGVRVYCF